MTKERKDLRKALTGSEQVACLDFASYLITLQEGIILSGQGHKVAKVKKSF